MVGPPYHVLVQELQLAQKSIGYWANIKEPRPSLSPDAQPPTPEPEPEKKWRRFLQ